MTKHKNNKITNKIRINESKNILKSMILVISLVISIIFLSTITYANIVFEKNNYELGEQVIFEINTEKDNRLEINHEDQVFRMLGDVNGEHKFFPDKIGNYTINIINNSEIINSKTFAVSQKNNEQHVFETNKKEYKMGEEVSIVLLKNINITKVLIRHEEREYFFVGIPQFPMSFYPDKTGTYLVILEDVNKNKYETTFESKLITSSLDRLFFETKNQGVNIVNSKGKKQNVEVLFHEIKGNENGLINLQEADLKVNNKYDVEVKKENNNVKLNIKGFNFKENTNIGIEEIKNKKINDKNSNIFSFKLDFEFEEINFSNVAQGTELVSCNSWNFEEQLCNGSWNKIKDIMPGEEYNIIINNNTTNAYAETGVASVNTKKSIYKPGEIAEIIIVILDKDGYLTPNAEIELNVTNPINETYTYSTNNEILGGEKGIYYLNHTTTIEGRYDLSINAKARNVNDSMKSYFLVMETYEFDIIRDTPVTIDPHLGPFKSRIKVSSLNHEIFNFTEVLPINFTIYDVGNATRESDFENTYLTWSNIKNNSYVEYYFNSPFIIPYLWEFNSYVKYEENNEIKTFQEARPWYIAIDPIIYYDPTSTITSGWSSGTGTTHTAISKTARQPTPPSTGTYISSLMNSGQLSEFGFSSITESGVEGITLWVFTHTEGNAQYTFSLRQGTTTVCSNTVPSGTSLSWRSCSWIPSGDLSSLSVHFSAVTRSGGGGPTYAFAYAAYLEVDTGNPPPSVSLNNPQDNAIENEPAEFSFIVTDENYASVTCYLYTNNTGSWGVTNTLNNVQTGVTTTTQATLSEGSYIWNVLCENADTKSAFAENNRTTYINTENPLIENEALNETIIRQNRTVKFNTSITDFYGIDTATITLRYPNSSLISHELIKNGDEYYYYITNTITQGIYNVTKIWANDTLGQITEKNTNLWFEVQAIPPTDFNLLQPINNTESRELTPTLSWEETSTPDFKNYTIIIDKDPLFQSPDFTYQITSISTTSYQVDFALDANSIYYWKVIAYDVFGNSKESLNNYKYVNDRINPTVILNNPINLVTNNNIINFYYTPNDANTIDYCELYTNQSGIFQSEKINYTIQKNQENYFTHTLPEGVFIWNVRCADMATNNAFASSNANILIDNTGPIINLVSPENNSLINDTNIISFKANAYDELTSVDYCELLINGSVADTNTEITSGIDFNFTTFLSNNYYEWNIICFDDLGNSAVGSSRFLTVESLDNDPPVISLLSPISNAFINSSSILFSYYVEDATGVESCSLFIDGTLEQTTGSSSVNVNIQRGVTTSTATTTIVDLNEVNPDNSFVLLTTRSGNSGPDVLLNTPFIVNSSSLELRKESATSAVISWEVIESSLFNVQRGEQSFSSVDNDLLIEISSINQANSFIIIYSRLQTGTIGNLNQGLWAGSFFNNTHIRLERSTSGTTGTVSWQVVSVNGGSVQSGSFSTAAISGTDSLTSQVDLNKTLLVFSRAMTGGTGLTDYNMRGVFTDNETIIFTRGRAQGTIRTEWFAIEHPYFDIQRGQTTISGSSAINQAISNVDTGKTASVVSWSSTGTGTTNANAFFTSELSSNTNLQFLKGTASQTQIAEWQVLSFDIPESSETITNFETNYFSVSGFSEDYHNWSVSCVDNSTENNVGISNTRFFTIDLTNPLVNLISPVNDSFFNYENINFEYTPQDINLAYCELYMNISGTFEKVMNNTNPISDEINIFNINIPSGIFEWNVLCHDLSERKSFAQENFLISIDTMAPQYQSLSEDPTSPFIYEENKLYVFNIAWIDNFGVDTVKIQHNFTGITIEEIIMSDNDEYNFSIQNLDAGTYFYKWIANDSSGNTNETINFNYVINKSEPDLMLYLNSVQNNLTINENNYVNIESEIIKPETGNIKLYINNELINEGMGLISNNTLFVEPGTYNVTVIYDETQNYLYRQESLFITVNDIMPPVISLLSPQNDSLIASGQRNLIYVVNDSSNIVSCSLYVNDTLEQTNNSITKNAEQFFQFDAVPGSYAWRITCIDEYSNEGTSAIRTFTSVDSDLINVVIVANSTYEKGGPAIFKVNTTDAFGNSIQTNLINHIITGNTSVPWWNTSWKKRQQLQINETSGTIQSNALIGINITGLNGNIQSCENELRLIKQEGAQKTIVPYIIYYTDNAQWCNIAFFGDLESNEVNTNYFVYYNNSVASNPNYNVNVMTTTLFNAQEAGADEGTPTNVVNIIGKNDGNFATISQGGGGGTHSAHGRSFINQLYGPIEKVDARYRYRVPDSSGTWSLRYSINDGADYSSFYSSAAVVGVQTTSPWYELTNIYPELTWAEINKTRLQGHVTKTGGGTITMELYWVELNITHYRNPEVTQTTNLEEENLLETQTKTTNSLGYTELSWDTQTQDLGTYSTIITASSLTYTDSTNYETFELIPDATPPVVTLISPEDLFERGKGLIDFTYFVFDYNLDYCTLFLGELGETIESVTSDIEVINNNSNTFDNVFVDIGVYEWNVECFDEENNSAFAPENFVLNISAPDLVVRSVDIWFEYIQLIEGVQINVFANVTNEGLSSVDEEFVVQFYLGNPLEDGLLIGSENITELNTLETKTVSSSHILTKGPNNIFVYADSSNVINESQEDNNIANNTLNVELYQYYYGSSKADIVLGKNDMSLFVEYSNISGRGGLVFFVDADADVSFENLQALTRNKDGNLVSGDFSALDEIMGTTNLIDSIKRTWGNNTDVPIMTRSFNLPSGTIENVPVVPSTDYDDFVTGILWDTSDDTGNQRFDSQDNETIVFVTEINPSRQGRFGVYDFEIRVPATLREYSGSTNKIAFYIELI